VAWLNRDHDEQQGIMNHYLEMSEHFRGLTRRTVLTYPLWGYPAVLLVLPDHRLVVVAQAALGALVMTALLLRLRRDQSLGVHGLALTVLFLAAVPWYLVHSVKWPLSFAASLVLLGLLLLDHALQTSRPVSGLLAGAAFGLALHFRSEFVFLPLLLLLVAWASRFAPGWSRLHPHPAALCAAMAWIVLSPWSAHYYRETGRVSLTSSNGGMLVFISLGQLPNNPWGAVAVDEYAYTYLTQRGITAPAESDTGSRVLFEEYLRRIEEHPGAFAAKIGWNVALTFFSGFYSGEIPLSPEETRQYALLRKRAKETLLRARSVGPVPDATVPLRVWMTFAYWLTTKAIGATFVIISTVGLGLSLLRWAPSRLLLLLATFICYQWILLLVLWTEPRFLNGLYPAYVPFFLVACSELKRRLRGLLHRRTAVA
jgi:hypothetical protein